MRRRALLVAVAGGLTLAGCVGGYNASTEPTTAPTESDPPSPSTEKPKDTPTAVRKTADGVTATFRVIDGHAPTEDTVDATFGEQRVTVTGSIDPTNCNRPTLGSVGYDADSGNVTLVVGEYSPYGETTTTVECGNASYDFRCVVTVDEGRPSVIKVTYDHPENDDQTFTVERN